jgi:hypothetical protein
MYKTFEINATYGSHKTETTVYVAMCRGGYWYVADGSKNINFTHELHDGINLESIVDSDYMHASVPVNSVSDLVDQIDS